MKIFNVMKPIDGFITKQILKLKETNEYQKLVDNFSGLEDSQQSIVKALMVFVLFFVPLVIILILSVHSDTYRPSPFGESKEFCLFR